MLKKEYPEMVIGNSPQWFLRKHADGEIFGPVAFDQIREWAMSAQIHPQDVLSNDGRTWNKAPMLAELQMDWLVEVPGQPLYGPTTAGTLLEFLKAGEISAETILLNCCTGEKIRLGETTFFPPPPPPEGSVEESLQDHILQLEMSLLEKQTELTFALDTVARLERRIKELEQG